MRKYTAIFAVAYLVLTIVVGLIAEALNLKGSTGFNIAATLAAGFIAAWKFSREEGRLPTTEEKKAFAWQGLLSVWLISLLLAVVVFALLIPSSESRALFNYMRSSTFILIGVVAMVFLSAIYYFTIRWSFSWYAKRAHKA